MDPRQFTCFPSSTCCISLLFTSLQVFNYTCQCKKSSRSALRRDTIIEDTYVLIHVLLNFREVAADDLDEPAWQSCIGMAALGSLSSKKRRYSLWRQVLCIQGVDAA